MTKLQIWLQKFCNEKYKKVYSGISWQSFQSIDINLAKIKKIKN